VIAILLYAAASWYAVKARRMIGTTRGINYREVAERLEKPAWYLLVVAVSVTATLYGWWSGIGAELAACEAAGDPAGTAYYSYILNKLEVVLWVAVVL